MVSQRLLRMPRTAWHILNQEGLASLMSKTWHTLAGNSPTRSSLSSAHSATHVPPRSDVSPERQRAHTERLNKLMRYPWFHMRSFSTDGTTLTIEGHAPETMAGHRGPFIALNGKRADRWIKYHPDADAEQRFSFAVERFKTSLFRLEVPLCEIGLDDQPHFEVGLVASEPGQDFNTFKKHYFPKDLGVYQVVPDDVRQKRVVSWANPAVFVHEGYSHWQIYKALAEQVAGRPVGSCESLLDWGCGCGRVTRHMIANRAPHQRVTGIDIDADNVRFAATHYPGGTFTAVDLLPPTPFADATFDFIIATSVMTHLEEAVQFQWLAELQRITKPGAVVILTTHGPTAVAWSGCSLEWIERWERTGFDAAAVLDHLKGYIASDDYYRNTFHTTEYIRRNWSRYFTICDIVEGTIAHQDAVVMRRNLSNRD